mmetsp:Transcript_3766/g.5135  ORF Transcript_3766/g.5135 Transcript_3766/m.5135 type:complete len:277 (+) Transcript_3766:1972-2802(+)
MLFPDAHPLLNIGTEEASTNTEVLSFEASSLKSGFKSSFEALVMASFKLELPPFFGADEKTLASTKNARELLKIKTFSDWDTKDGYTGARYQMHNSVQEATKTLQQSSMSLLSGAALSVSTSMISLSNSFLNTLIEWISQEFADLMGRAGDVDEATEAAIWKLISHCIRTIFKELHVCRLPGRGPFLSQDHRAGCVLWGCLQAHLRMQTFVSQGFSADSKLSHVLNLHLQDNAVMQGEFKAFKKKVIEVEKQTLASQKIANQAKSLADKANASKSK